MNHLSSPRYFIHSFERGLRVLEAFANKKKPLNLSELANLTGLSVPTARRYIKTLENLGYLNLGPDKKKYNLTPKILSLGFELLNSMELRTRLNPYMVSLNQEFDVSVNLAVLDDTDIVFIERLRALSSVSLNYTSGSRIPAYCTALGRAILAFLDPNQRNDIVDRMKLLALTRYTIIDKDKLLKELESTHLRGYAISNQQIFLGWSNYAIPIFFNEKVEASLGISFPYNLPRKKEFVNLVIDRMLEIRKKISS